MASLPLTSYVETSREPHSQPGERTYLLPSIQLSPGKYSTQVRSIYLPLIPSLGQGGFLWGEKRQSRLVGWREGDTASSREKTSQKSGRHRVERSNSQEKWCGCVQRFSHRDIEQNIVHDLETLKTAPVSSLGGYLWHNSEEKANYRTIGHDRSTHKSSHRHTHTHPHTWLDRYLLK